MALLLSEQGGGLFPLLSFNTPPFSSGEGTKMSVLQPLAWIFQQNALSGPHRGCCR